MDRQWDGHDAEVDGWWAAAAASAAVAAAEAAEAGALCGVMASV